MNFMMPCKGKFACDKVKSLNCNIYNYIYNYISNQQQMFDLQKRFIVIIYLHV